MQAADWQTLRQFPPLSIAQLASQRDVVQKYASQHMVRASDRSAQAMSLQADEAFVHSTSVGD